MYIRGRLTVRAVKLCVRVRKYAKRQQITEGRDDVKRRYNIGSTYESPEVEYRRPGRTAVWRGRASRAGSSTAQQTRAVRGRLERWQTGVGIWTDGRQLERASGEGRAVTQLGERSKEQLLPVDGLSRSSTEREIDGRASNAVMRGSAGLSDKIRLVVRGTRSGLFDDLRCERGVLQNHRSEP